MRLPIANRQSLSNSGKKCESRDGSRSASWGGELGPPGEPMADQHANDPLLGTRFHDYRIEQQLARGGMGAVYLCRHVELPHVCKVLKVIATELIEEPDQSAPLSVRANAERARAFIFDRFEREAAAVSQLRHRYIAPIDGIGTVDGRRCILMPYLEGKALDQILLERGGHLTPHETLHIAAQIARALDHAHQRGIVHRDLKPGNVFVTPTEDDPLAIKVIDFGIAKQMHAQVSTSWRGPMGTLLFMAVEQFEHASEATALADVYSLAVMVYVMITGRYPWGEQESAFALYRRQLDEPPDPAPSMPVGWEEILFAALSPNPQQRPQSMRELVYPLALLLAASQSHKSGLEILGAVARRWAESSPLDETLRGTAATSGAWRAAMSGAWPATPSSAWPAAAPVSWPAGSLPAATPGAWPTAATSGSWPAATPGAWPTAATSGSWPSTSTSQPDPMEPTSTALSVAGGILVPAAWKLALLAVGIAVLVGIVVFAMIALVRARTPEPTIPPVPPTYMTTAPGSR